MLHYTYKITHTETNQYYVGRHTTLNLDDNYYGSGVWVSKQPKNKLKKEIVEFYSSIENLLIAEETLIEKNFDNPLCMNKIKSSSVQMGSYGLIHNEETKKYIGNLNRGNKYRIGKKHTEETKNKLRRKATGRKHSQKTKEKMSKLKKGMLPWNTGNQLTEEHKSNLSKSLTGRVHSEQSRKKMAETKYKKYLVIHPCGKEEIILGLSKWCKENNVDRSNAVKVLSGKYKQTKGYKFFKL
jgi:hypothetical protein